MIPHLLLLIPYPDISPVALAIGPFAIRWYALAYISALLLGWRYCLYLSTRKPLILRSVDVDDFLVWATFGIVLGGRIGYVLFYRPGYYIYNLSEIPKLWHGGMSFHGGCLGVTIALVLFCKRRSIPLLGLADIVACSVPIGLFFGRLANFINGELYGRQTDVAWAMIFPNDPLHVPRHPSQLYQASMEGIILFVLLNVLELGGARRRGGVITGTFLIGYACARSIGELFRQPDQQLGFLLFGTTMGQLLSIPMVLGGRLSYLASAAGDGDDACVSLDTPLRGDLAEIIAARIRKNGPIGVDAFMAAALADPVYGYYMTRDPLGRAGDFTTSPEISQVFGELIGAWCAAIWQSLGKPEPLRLIELGPGRGTLMADALRAFRPLSNASDAVRVHFVETSPILKLVQSETLARHHPEVAATWHDDLDSVPAGTALIIANEFFDALPIKQWIRRGASWKERCVDRANDHFVFVEGPEKHPPLEPAQSSDGEIFETNESALSIAHQIGERLGRQKGAALIIDYGHLRSACGETLQAIGKHRYADVLEAPGTVDLTAHVDFEALIRNLKQAGARVADPITQATFLIALGGTIRTKLLAEGKDPETAEKISGGFRRLVYPAGMGHLFKAVGAASANIDFLPGFGPLRR